MQDNILQPIVPSGTALLADPQLAHIQADIIGDHHQLSGHIYLVVVRYLPDALSAQIHISEGLNQNDFLSVNITLADNRLMLSLQHGYLVFLRNLLYDPEADIMPGILIFSARIAQARDNKHSFPPMLLFRFSFRASLPKHGRRMAEVDEYQYYKSLFTNIQP